METKKSRVIRYCDRKFNSAEVYNKDCFLKELYRIIPESNIKLAQQYTTTDLQIETKLNHDTAGHDVVLKIDEIGAGTRYVNGTLWIFYEIPYLWPLYVKGILFLVQGLIGLYYLVYCQDDLAVYLQIFQASIGR